MRRSASLSPSGRLRTRSASLLRSLGRRHLIRLLRIWRILGGGKMRQILLRPQPRKNLFINKELFFNVGGGKFFKVFFYSVESAPACSKLIEKIPSAGKPNLLHLPSGFGARTSASAFGGVFRCLRSEPALCRKTKYLIFITLLPFLQKVRTVRNTKRHFAFGEKTFALRVRVA
jgi:hypothetical protein